MFFGPEAKRIILSNPDFPKPVPKPERLAYTIRISKLGGLGMIAARNLKLGDLVCAERPLLVSDRPLAPLPPGATLAQVAIYQQWEKSLEYAFKRMLPEKQAAFLALANSHTKDGSGVIHGIIRTNGFGSRVKEPGGSNEVLLSVVCDAISRVNHRCVVFAQEWSKISQALDVVAPQTLELVSIPRRSPRSFAFFGISMRERRFSFLIVQ